MLHVFKSKVFLWSLQLFKCFNRLGICQGADATRRNIDFVVRETDEKLMEWKKLVEDRTIQISLHNGTLQ